jgi:hypothetical protein
MCYNLQFAEKKMAFTFFSKVNMTVTLTHVLEFHGLCP